MNFIPNLISFESDINSESVGQKWITWIERFENYMLCADMAMTEGQDNKQIARLLHFAGPSVYAIYQANKKDNRTYDGAKIILANYFNPRKNKQFARFEFRQAKWNQEEPVDTYIARLNELVAACEFADKGEEMVSMLVQNCPNSVLKRQILSIEEPDYEKVVKTIRTFEAVNRQLKMMNEQNVEQVNAVGHRYPKEKPGRTNMCRQCGRLWPHEGDCPAKGKECMKCHHMNHFASECRTRQPNGRPRYYSENSRNNYNQQINQLEAANENLFTFEDHDGKPTVSIQVNNQNIRFLVDSGTRLNVIDEATFDKLNPRPRLAASKINGLPYGIKVPIENLGSFRANIEFKGRNRLTEFEVLKGQNGCLLGYVASSELNIIRIINQLESERKPNTAQALEKETIIGEYPSLFENKLENVNYL